MKPKILIVDDDRLFLEQCLDILVDLDAELLIASSGTEAFEIISEKNIDLIILDLILKDMNGEEVLDKVKKKHPDIDFIIVTGYATVESVINLMKKGILDFIKKPLVPEEFKFSILKCLKQREIIQENKKLKEYLFLYDLGKIITSSLELSKVYDNILVALTNYLPNTGIIIYNADVTDFLEVKAFSGFDRNQMFELKELILEFIKDSLQINESDKILEFSTKSILKNIQTNYNNLYILPIQNISKKNGYILLFTDSLSQDKQEGLLLLQKHIKIGIENALRYLNAQELAYIDDLTKAYNIRYLYVSLDNELKRAERFGTNVSILFIDLDFFKNVNDQYGHLVGSKLLIEFTNEIKKCVRGIDTVIRYGGDEFIVICTETDVELAKKVAERLRRRTEECEFLKKEGYSIHITCSIGIATYPTHGTTKTELIDLADKAMYRGKEISRNIVCVAEKG
ncbi:MAG: diguanylate cyclase [Proteobacteria bacterium]|nr:diguanylate cyclase [Pseudomonadota bacterium]